MCVDYFQFYFPVILYVKTFMPSLEVSNISTLYKCSKFNIRRHKMVCGWKNFAFKEPWILITSVLTVVNLYSIFNILLYLT